MNAMKAALLAISLAPALCIAAETTTPQQIVVPGAMTTTGTKFASQCNDDAFSRSADKAKLAGKCQRLLARWHAEVDVRRERRQNPRLIAVAKAEDTHANLPFDTVAALRSDPFTGIGAGH